jgi:hypothetical protein
MIFVHLFWVLSCKLCVITGVFLQFIVRSHLSIRHSIIHEIASLNSSRMNKSRDCVSDVGDLALAPNMRSILTLPLLLSPLKFNIVSALFSAKYINVEHHMYVHASRGYFTDSVWCWTTSVSNICITLSPTISSFSFYLIFFVRKERGLTDQK